MRSIALVASLSFAIASCGGDDAALCADVVFEDLHPQSAVHVITDEGIVYLTDPPTSGPHASSRVPTEGLTLPLPPSMQVAVLEAGGVIMQYQPGAVSQAELERLGDARLVMFEHADLGDPVVVTAWRQKLTCAGFDEDAVRGFRDDHGGDGEPHG